MLRARRFHPISTACVGPVPLVHRAPIWGSGARSAGMRKKGETGIDTHHRLYPLRATANADLSVFGKVGTEGAGFWSKWCRDVRGAARRVGTPNQFTCRFEPGAPVGVSTVGWTGKEKWAPEDHVHTVHSPTSKPRVGRNGPKCAHPSPFLREGPAGSNKPRAGHRATGELAWQMFPCCWALTSFVGGVSALFSLRCVAGLRSDLNVAAFPPSDGVPGYLTSFVCDGLPA
jgi:hypothetical protein